MIVAAIFFAGDIVLGQTASPLPIEKIRDISFDQDRSIAYILNGDDTISAYNFVKKEFLFSRIPLLGAANPKQILVSSDGSIVALLQNPNGKEFSVTIYNVSSNEEKDILVPGPSYRLDGALTQGKVNMFFPPEGNTLFVGYGENSLHIFSTNTSRQETVAVGQFPTAIDIDSAGMVLVINEKSENLSIVDPFKKIVRATVQLGSSPQKILFNKVTNKAYISHVGSDDIYVVDTKLAKVLQKIKVGNDPTSLAYDEKDGTVFVANNSSGTLSIISPDFEVKTVDLKSPAYFESAPLKFAYLNNGKKLFIINTSEGKYLVYDVKQARIVKEGETEAFPVEVFVSEKMNLAFTWHWAANSIYVIDAGTFVISYIPDSIKTAATKEIFFSKPQSVAVDTETNRIFVSNLGDDYITVIDGNTQKPTAKINVGRSIQNIFLNKKTRKLYAVSPPDNTLIVVDISKDNYSLIKTVQLEQQPRGGAINEITNRIYYSNSATAKVSVIDGSEDKVIATIDLPAKSFPLVNTLDEKRNKIYTALYGNDSVAVVDGKSNKIEKFITVGVNPIWVRYLPEIDRIFVSVEGEKKVLVIDPDSNKILQTLQISGKPYRIFFDPTTNYVYINHRGEDIVTILKFLEFSNAFEIIEDRSMKYWGETDARPYNMLIYNEKTQLLYLTEGVADRVHVVKPGHDDKNILQGSWYATINADGSVIYSQEASGELAQKSKRTLYTVIGAVIILISVIIAIIMFRRRRVDV